jgi:hypothetical protein
MSDQKVTGNFPTLEQLALSQLRERFPPSFTLLAWRKSLWSVAGDCRSWDHPHRPRAATDDMIVDLIAGLLDAGVWRRGLIDVELSALTSALVCRGDRRLLHRRPPRLAGCRANDLENAKSSLQRRCARAGGLARKLLICAKRHESC